MQVTTIGLDLAKNVFQVHGTDEHGEVAFNRALRRAQVLAFFERLEPCLVSIEACGTSHHLARELIKLGHNVKLIPPAYVKPYVKRGKSDSVDAAAICEAVTRPTMRFVEVKTPEQQAILSVRRQLEGEALKQFRRNYSDPNRGPTGRSVAKYQALKHTCQACPSKMKCCPKADARKITREEHEDARDVAPAIRKTRHYKVSSKLRKKVEMLFAHLKRILRLGRLRLRGPCGTNDEFLLAATAQYLRKLAKIFPAPQQTRKA